MKAMRKVWLAGLTLWLTGCGLSTPEPLNLSQGVVATPTSTSDQEQVAVPKSEAEPTSTKQVSTATTSSDHAKLLLAV